MCGIVTAIGDFNHGHAKFFDWMVFMDTIRGPHSTGLATVNLRTHETNVFKTMAPGSAAVMLEDWKNARGYHQGVWIGHNRYATHGAVNLDNAHPFSHGDITGVHNGSLSYSWEWDLSELNPPTFGTDSETLYWCIANHGLEATLPLVEGDFALVYYDKSDKSMNFLHNGTRPLHYVATRDGKALYISSLAEIPWLLEAQLKGATASLQTCYEFKPLKHYKLKLPEKQSDYDFREGEWEWDSVTEFTHGEAVKPRTYSYTSSYGKWGGWGSGKKSSASTTASATHSGGTNKGDGLAVYAKYLKSNNKRLENDDYLTFIFKSMPTDEEKREKLEVRYNKLHLASQIKWPVSQIATYTPNQMKPLVARLQQLSIMQDQMAAYDGTWEVYHDPSDKDRREQFIKLQTQPCFNCRDIDIGGAESWKPEDCLFLPDGSYICPDCSELPVLQQYAEQIKDEIETESVA